MSQRSDLLISRRGVAASCAIEYSRKCPWRLHYWDEELGHVMCCARDLFESLRQLRLVLEMHGDGRIFCNGARLDAWASNMARDMGGGRMVYITRVGVRAQTSDLVPTFDPTPGDTVGTVREQMNHHIAWLESLMEREKGPPKLALAEAKLHPNGWVYKIEGDFGADDEVPSEAIVGAWQVDANGVIVGEFMPNPNCRSG